ncbi:MAG: hypothetical protein AAF626_12890 [Pseudomonadota bacterium]
MFKTALTAAALATLVATSSASAFELAGPADMLTIDSLGDITVAAVKDAPEAEVIETAAYCEWVTIYDYWGNWFTVWQCY